MESVDLRKKIESLDIDWLKNNNERLYYFGLGFIQLKINDKYRLHFYTDKLDSNTDSIHNHRYNFESKILKGSFKNKIYNVDYWGNTHVKVNESCNEEIQVPKNKEACTLKLVSDITYYKNDEYYMHYESFHRVESNYAITLLKRSDYKQDYAQIIYEKNKEPNCPFSVKLNEEYLWNIIEEMIND